MSKPATALRRDYLSLTRNLPPGGLVLLPDVAWNEYQALLNRVGEASHLRLSYNNGRLQIMSPSPEHEGIAGLLPPLIYVLAEECRLNYLSRRSTTLQKQGHQKGTEPDDCFYFKNFKLISGKKRIDLNVDPPPELAFEVDITNPSLNKFPIYAAIGVQELWRHTGQAVYFYRLEEGKYLEIDRSDLFPFLTPQDVFSFLSIGEAEGAIVMGAEFREWIKANKEKQQ
ncbi:MAG TPA: Uma2 family endonuclease [Blastocatellia bacterium]|nr:Uma2 family endonuclease [Blastocatellia bacterium]HMV86874.1 Uma2 family endonuclease [Blastocatellia bacterium]HMX25372.1 Uma2 family endonuclease [Blastocatellia bacterium]HMY74548.1 Uma2 family endonuclease [Blastocatellia bacterium]HMZ19953.1 Uma2 family endonuclease [Blastocatellia bacterium]